MGIGVAMALCALVNPLYSLLSQIDWFAVSLRRLDRGAFGWMALSALITTACGFGLWWRGRHASDVRLGRREAILTVALIWVISGVFGGLPFVLDAKLDPVDAYFEAVSGFTTTGSTILDDIEGTLSRPVLLWRSLMQWLGGMGIVVLFVAVFPNIGVGGKHMFRSEVPGPTAEGLQPRIAETSFTLWRLYAVLTAVLIVLLMLLGMGPFDAVCHAFTAMSTGGFSTYDASIAAFDSVAIEMVLAVFMLIAGVNFGLYYGVLHSGSLRVFRQSTEFKVYCSLVVGCTALLTFAIWPEPHTNLFEAFRRAFFMVSTTITSTGYGTDDYMLYSSWGLSIVLLLMLIGGSAGSTAGGIKVARMVLLARVALSQIRRSVRPSVIQVVRMGKAAVPESVLTDVTAFFVVYILCLAGGTALICLIEEVSVPTSFGAVLTCLSNMGPGPFHEGSDNFASYGPAAKVLFSTAMILGRLEFFTLLALLLPDFWRH